MACCLDAGVTFGDAVKIMMHSFYKTSNLYNSYYCVILLLSFHRAPDTPHLCC